MTGSDRDPEDELLWSHSLLPPHTPRRRRIHDGFTVPAGTTAANPSCGPRPPTKSSRKPTVKQLQLRSTRVWVAALGTGADGAAEMLAEPRIVFTDPSYRLANRAGHTGSSAL